MGVKSASGSVSFTDTILAGNVVGSYACGLVGEGSNVITIQSSS